jgi:hypothetical protein
MFKAIFVLSCICAVSFAFPQDSDQQAKLLSDTFADDGAGNIAYAFETSNSIKTDVKGQLKDADSGDGNTIKVITMKGSYSYTAKDGTPITVEWEADENGKKNF